MPWTPRAQRTQAERRHASTRQWRKVRGQVLDRDRHRCQACGGKAGEVHHLVHGAGDHPSNLVSLCGPCHSAETHADATAARRKLTNNRPPTPHPGLRT